jgi:hypothetical protein
MIMIRVARIYHLHANDAVDSDDSVNIAPRISLFSAVNEERGAVNR